MSNNNSTTAVPVDNGNSAISTFNFEAFPVRVIKDSSGEPWFVAGDVAEVLGYADTATKTRRQDDDAKGMQNLQTLGGNQNHCIINESGLYRSILASNKPEAKKFRKWITLELLPSIRKHGGYLAAAPQMNDTKHIPGEYLVAKRSDDFGNHVGFDVVVSRVNNRIKMRDGMCRVIALNINKIAKSV